MQRAWAMHDGRAHACKHEASKEQATGLAVSLAHARKLLHGRLAAPRASHALVCLQVFDVLASSPHAATDTFALVCMQVFDVLASGPHAATDTFALVCTQVFDVLASGPHAATDTFALVCTQVFDVLASSPHSAMDMFAWNALATVHAAQGAMREAELAAARATEVAASQVGSSPPCMHACVCACAHLHASLC